MQKISTLSISRGNMLISVYSLPHLSLSSCQRRLASSQIAPGCLPAQAGAQMMALANSAGMTKIANVNMQKIRLTVPSLNSL
jgi:hypothetical protein